jgi:hypothetical protein
VPPVPVPLTPVPPVPVPLTPVPPVPVPPVPVPLTPVPLPPLPPVPVLPPLPLPVLPVPLQPVPPLVPPLSPPVPVLFVYHCLHILHILQNIRIRLVHYVAATHSTEARLASGKSATSACESGLSEWPVRMSVSRGWRCRGRHQRELEWPEHVCKCKPRCSHALPSLRSSACARAHPARPAWAWAWAG